MAIVTGDRYLEKLVAFVEKQAGYLIEGTLVLKLNPAGLHYVQSRLEALHELESLLAGAPVDYLRAYVSDLGDHRALEQLRRILRLLTSLKVVSILPPPGRDPTPLSFLPFGRLKVLELRGCDLSTSAAKGLLELRHTLEKIICHNSTDALRHVFASRIAEIKDSPQWNRLSFVSCACNGLLLMDESLQLLPAVETLDLSRNKFAKVDNLQKCTRLKHLDLGFNHLRTIVPFGQVSRHIVKLVLRNNALTTLRGIENLKSLEGLDVSYNIISNFSELEFLEGLSFLHSLWMEGNPLCCAQWYRAQVFSFFAYPEKLKLDDTEISKSDFWKRQVIIASKHKQPASFGLYIPAKDEICINRTRRKVFRLALIENEEETIYSDPESVSCENEVRNTEDPGLSDDEAEIVDLINKVEHMKKERSVHWLREFKEWMDVGSDKFVENSKVGQAALRPQKEHYIRNSPSQRQPGEVPRYASESVLASGDESSTNILESDSSFVDLSSSFNSQQYFDHRGSLANASSAHITDLRGLDQDRRKCHSPEGVDAFMSSRSLHSDTSTTPGGPRIAENVNISPLHTIVDVSACHESSVCTTSPPHYQEGLLQRRQYLVEELLQLSADSNSVASSDSNTSGSEVDYTESEPLMPEVNNLPNHNYLNDIVDEHIYLSTLKENNYNQGQGIPLERENDIYSSDPSTAQASEQDAGADNSQDASFVNQDADSRDNRKSRKKPRKRVITILEESSDGNACDCECELQQGLSRQMPANVRNKLDVDIASYFHLNIADSEAEETCNCYVRCNCVLPGDLIYTEREVAVLLSSHKNLYVLLINDATNGSGTFLSILSCHKVEEVCEVLVGVGVELARVRFDSGETHLFITRSIEKSRDLLQTLEISNSCGPNDRCSIRRLGFWKLNGSLEQVQVALFDHQICGGSSVNIYQYAMVLVWCNNNKEGSWLPRSLFVIEGHVLLCIEDIMQFSSFSSDASLPPYFIIDSCCSINDITELVMEVRETYCVTLVLERLMSEFHHPTKSNIEAVNHGNRASGSLKLKLQWFCEDNLWKFVSLLKAINARKPTSPLVVRCI